jgi:hypothetical protein
MASGAGSCGIIQGCSEIRTTSYRANDPDGSLASGG